MDRREGTKDMHGRLICPVLSCLPALPSVSSLHGGVSSLATAVNRPEVKQHEHKGTWGAHSSAKACILNNK